MSGENGAKSSTESTFDSLVNDPLGRQWVQIKLGNDSDIEAGLLTIMYPGGETNAIGNAFIISNQVNSAICLTAAHNLDHIKQIQKEKSGRAGHPTVPDVLRNVGTEYVDPKGLALIYAVGGKCVVCSVPYLSYIGNNDLALMIVVMEKNDEFPTGFLGQYAIDFSIPTLGDEVAMVGYRMIETPQADGSFQLERQLQVHSGFVTSNLEGRDRKGQFFSFQTSLPVMPGLSGSPVMRTPTDADQPAAVCGVMSWDSSDQEAFESFLKAGASNVAALFPAAGLGVVSRLEVRGETNARFVSVAELATKAILNNVTPQGVTLDAEFTAEKTIIDFRDDRVMTGPKIRLETSPNPLFSQGVGLDALKT